MKLKYITLLLPVLMMAQPKQKPLVVGETITFHSKELKEDRTLNIYLPQGYNPEGTPYPVIYLLDGSMDEDFLHIAGLVQFASFEWINKLPPSIVVGIANVDRKRDFTSPSQNKDDLKTVPTSGGSAAFINFIEKEVFREIESRYRASKERTIIGQSLGGLLATEILVTKPQAFNNYIIISPSLWWNNGALLEQVKNFAATRKYIYIAVGKEGDVMEGDAKKLAALLQQKHTVHFEYLPQYSHGDILHFAVYNAFGKLFSK